MNIFGLYNTNQQLVLPINLEIMIPENDFVRLLLCGYYKEKIYLVNQL